MKVGTAATYTDPLTRRSVTCTIMETVRTWAGDRHTGIAYAVVDANGRHWTARPNSLKEN